MNDIIDNLGNIVKLFADISLSYSSQNVDLLQ
jgi:hypothetical protein